ncbi:hypothetical protein BJY52DRAFT_1226578 [Lactarius psammicola]|nr:hypothetical protein BJY52DRAFT_1226578 [Lactarius psammicola]
MPPLSVQTGTGRNGERRANPLIPASHSRVALHATGGVGALAGLRLATVHVPPLRANEGGRTQMMGWREPPPLSSLRGQLSRVALCAREVEGGEKGGSSFMFPCGLAFACSLWVQKGGWGGRATPIRPPVRKPSLGGKGGECCAPPCLRAAVVRKRGRGKGGRHPFRFARKRGREVQRGEVRTSLRIPRGYPSIHAPIPLRANRKQERGRTLPLFCVHIFAQRRGREWTRWVGRASETW